MLSSVLKYILTSLLSLAIISMLLFFISKAVPGDSIRDLILSNTEESFNENYQNEYNRIASEYRLDKPFFYFSFLPKNFPANINKELPLERKKWIKDLLFKGYQYDDIKSLKSELEKLAIEKPENISQEKTYLLESLNLTSDLTEIGKSLDQIESSSPGKFDTSEILSIMNRLENGKKSYLIPKMHWHGLDNQYHIWISNLIKGDAGTSYLDRKDVKEKISRAMVWTFFLVLLSLILSYVIGIAIGILLASMKKQKRKRFFESVMFGLYAIPLFWLATLLLVFFTTKEYGSWTNIFPSVGLTPIDTGERWYVRLFEYGSQLILPSFCLVLHNLAFLSSLTKRNIERNMKLPFVRTLRAYGFSEKEILFKNVLRHSLLPLITSITSSIPAALGGTIIIEIIFNIPGMGRLLYTGILNYDWPIVFGTVMFIALITIISFLLGEIAYRYSDPRIKTQMTG